MISYNPDQKNIGKKEFYSRNFRAVDTDDPRRIAKALTGFVVSPIIYKGGHRHTNNFISSNWIGLDFDEGPSLEEITRAFCDVIHVIGTTKSHQIIKGTNPPCDRFRVFLRLPVTITSIKEYKQILAWYTKTYESDTNCKDAARFFWPCKEITSICDDGDLVDIKKDESIDDLPTFLEHEGFRHQRGILSHSTYHALMNEIKEGMRHKVFLKVANELARAGLSHQDAEARILSSPTFSGKTITPELEDSIKDTRRAIKDAYKYVHADKT